MSEHADHGVGRAIGGGEPTPPDTTDPARDGADRQSPRPTAAPTTRRRRVLVNGLVVLATLLALVGMLSVWANRLLFNPDNWENTSTQLLANSEIRSATSNYLVDQLYANFNVAGFLKSRLPTQFQPLAGPAAGALRNAAVQGIDAALTRPKVQTLWAKANRAADEAFITIVNGGTKNVKINQGVVTLNLAGILNQVAVRLGLPSNVAAKLPPNIAHLTVLKSNQLKAVQNIGNAIRHLALWLTIIVPLLYAGAILLARGRRRRTLMTVGFAIVLAGALGVAARQLLQSAITNSLVSDQALRPAVRATIGIGTSLLGEINGAFLLVGSVLVAAAWFAGPAGVATASRRAIAPFLRDHPAATFTIAAAVMLLVFIWDPIPATGTPVGIIVFSALAMLGTELLRRQTAVEFPDARQGEVTAALRHMWRGRRGRSSASDSADGDVTEQLTRLASLRREDAISREEYDAAKTRLLRS